MQKKVLSLLVAILFLFPLTASSQPINDLVLITEQYPPFNFEIDGKVQGITVDVLVKLLEKTGSTLKREDIKVWPWARGYNKVQTKKNTCLFGMTRNEKREKLFKWVGPVAPTKTSLIARKDSNIKIQSDKDLYPYKIGVIRDDIGEQRVLDLGVPPASVHAEAKAESCVNILNIKRIDLWAYDEITAMWFIKGAGLNTSDFQAVHTIDTGYMYYAFHIDTPDETIQKLQSALDELKSSGEYQKILDSYLK